MITDMVTNTMGIYFIKAFKICLTIIFTCFLKVAFSQSDTTGLKTRLQSAAGAERAGLLNELAKSYLDINPTVSFQYATEALSLAELEFELRNKELTCNAMAIIRRNEAVTEMVEALEEAMHSEIKHGIFDSLIERFRNHDKDTNWKEFEGRFTQVHNHSTMAI